jgi:hypothetical protein
MYVTDEKGKQRASQRWNWFARYYLACLLISRERADVRRKKYPFCSVSCFSENFPMNCLSLLICHLSVPILTGIYSLFDNFVGWARRQSVSVDMTLIYLQTSAGIQIYLSVRKESFDTIEQKRRVLPSALNQQTHRRMIVLPAS